MIQLVVSTLLYFVIFYGIAFILNMLFRTTWFMSIIFPFIIVIIIDGISTFDYITKPGESFSALGDTLTSLATADYVIIGAGFLGTVLSGVTIKFLRKNGYRMF